ncbi:unnamed protein product [Polarella glacialis]|uniref:Cytochrome b5 heme-binding domain-containing protein n=1 Tax=Polarella glacialis TaxID=89957 RepID=A0A813G7N3_POLGL|nr:unnamed protein product [Polarella glacialis]CAE8661588.1 unnamed protein product [Polarella glacialis]
MAVAPATPPTVVASTHQRFNMECRKTARGAARACAPLQQQPDPAEKEIIANSELWTIHGKRYNMRDYVHMHPGGQHAILLGQGIDCTVLFETNHPFTERHRKMLAPYLHDELPEPTCVDESFNWKVTPFYDEVKLACIAHFSPRGDETSSEVQRNSKATWAAWLEHGIGLLLLALAFYAWCCDAFLSMLYFPALYFWVGSDLMHNGSHFAMSRKAWINTACSYLGVFHVQHHCWAL